MDINAVKTIRNSISTKDAETIESQKKKQDKKNGIKGCLKLADYMAF